MIQELKDVIKKKSPMLATATSIILTIAGVGFAIKSSRKVADILDEYDEKKEEIENKPLAEKKNTDILALKIDTGVKIASACKESLACAAVAVGIQIVTVKKLSELATSLGAALALKEDRIQKVFKKADDIYGKEAGEDLKEAVYCDVPPFDEDDIQKGKRKRRKEKTEHLERYYEPCSGRMFEAYPSDVDAALAHAQKRFDKEGTLNYNKYSSILGLPDVDMGVCQDWDKENPFGISQKIVPVDGYECIGLIPDYEPVSKRFKYLY